MDRRHRASPAVRRIPPPPPNAVLDVEALRLAPLDTEGRHRAVLSDHERGRGRECVGAPR